MNKSRILIVSDARPSRTWNFAKRIQGEVPGTEICGIVQRSIDSLPRVQQMIAAGKTRATRDKRTWYAKVLFLTQFVAEKVVQWFFWFVHGCPAPLNNPKRFTIKRLRRECDRTGWPVAIAAEGKEAHAAISICSTDVDLVIFLGELRPFPELLAHATTGCLQARSRSTNNNPGSKSDVSIHIELFAPGPALPSTIFSLVLPWQPFDGTLGLALKTDLIADDLLLQAAAPLLSSDPGTASRAVSQWASRTLAPTISQLNRVRRDSSPPAPIGGRCRSTWKLCLDALLLCSPGILGRNWYRRMVGRYPLLILTHHLVSDRPHRMGVPTEVFWRQVLFLQKHYRIASLAEGAELLRSGRIRVPTVALTLDDGYADNFLNLRAVASELELPSTLFVATEPVETHREFDHDLRTGWRGFFPLTWDQIQYWSIRGADFGSHTRTHFDCGSSDLEALQSEIIGSRNDLEARLKRPVSFFAFPYGKPENMSSEAMHLAASTYRHFVSSFGGESLPQSKQSRNHLHRKKFYGSLWELQLELQSVFDAVDAMKERFFPRSTRPSSNPNGVPVLSEPPGANSDG